MDENLSRGYILLLQSQHKKNASLIKHESPSSSPLSSPLPSSSTSVNFKFKETLQSQLSKGRQYTGLREKFDRSTKYNKESESIIYEGCLSKISKQPFISSSNSSPFIVENNFFNSNMPSSTIANEFMIAEKGIDQSNMNNQIELPPKDDYNLIYFGLLLAGIGFLLPYNSFVIAVDYFQVKYPGTTIVFDISFVYILIALFSVILNNLLIDLYWRINIGQWYNGYNPPNINLCD